MLYSAGLQVEPDLFRLDEVKEQRYFPFIPSSSLLCHAHSLHSAYSQLYIIHSLSRFLFPWELIMCTLFLHLELTSRTFGQCPNESCIFHGMDSLYHIISGLNDFTFDVSPYISFDSRRTTKALVVEVFMFPISFSALNVEQILWTGLLHRGPIIGDCLQR